MATKASKETTGEPMLRVLITQKNEDGSIKKINGVEHIGGVIIDNIGEKLGYVFDESKYDNNMKRKEKFYVKNWYKFKDKSALELLQEFRDFGYVIHICPDCGEECKATEVDSDSAICEICNEVKEFEPVI